MIKKKNNCLFWNCDISPKKNEYNFCVEHYYDDSDGFLKKCKSCKNFIDVYYDFCLDCKNNSKKPSKYSKKYQLESNPAWDKSDKEIKTFFVYILKLNNGDYYAGQTNNLRRRIYQHKETQSTKSTKSKEAKLVWFVPVNSRDSAVKAECELKKTIDNNPSKIDEKIIAFRDLVNELYLGE